MALSKKNSLPCLAFLIGSLMFHITYAQNSRRDFVALHNRARAEVGVQPMVWNKTVAAYAQNYANIRSADCNLEHSQGGPYGENIAYGSGEFTAVDAGALWVGEKPLYNYNSNSCVGGECLHYTQVVWRDSTQLGCARVQCQNGYYFVTCNYYPPGNYIGQRPF
ncbi:hypothetical protein Leryth_025394 [Lithospermum erythrorhizon]|uniref:Defense/immunity protein n=1 Tax=Lithospermum erythrorhizon TaxID=34254 RepID=A0AAV3RPA5_LITER|nr:hypothetical protein Leryth_025394 [Lithospermum erythrorhizon]